MRSQDKKLRDLIAEQAAEWHVAHSEGSLSPAQSQEFMRWLRTSPVHVAEYLTVARLASDLSDAARGSVASLQDLLVEQNECVRTLPTDMEGDSAHSLAALSPWSYQARLPRPMHLQRRSGRPAPHRALAVAASVVVFAALAVGWPWFASRPTVETFATHHGEERSLQLQDGTLLQLDTDSAVTVRFDRHSRHVVVDRGQAYFNVARDAGRPFSVQAGRSLVRDIGTAFGVYRRASDTTITVAEGRVQVLDAPSHGAHTGLWPAWLRPEQQPRGEPIADLGPGEQACVANSGEVTSRRRVDVARALAWTQGRIAFDDTPVESVVAELNRYNNVQIGLAGSRIAAQRINGTLASHDVSAFVAFLESQPGVRVVTHDQRILVYDDGQDRHRK